MQHAVATSVVVHLNCALMTQYLRSVADPDPHHLAGSGILDADPDPRLQNWHLINILG
jgi:hypothetical protein